MWLRGLKVKDFLSVAHNHKQWPQKVLETLKLVKKLGLIIIIPEVSIEPSFVILQPHTNVLHGGRGDVWHVIQGGKVVFYSPESMLRRWPHECLMKIS